MKRAIVIDTNAYSAYKRGKFEAEEVLATAETVVMPATVLGELLAGFRAGKRSKANHQELQEFLADPHVLFFTVNAQTAEEYAKVYQHLRSQGTPIPTNDMWIAAMALQLEMPVFTYDAHFSKIEGLKIVRTVSDWDE